MEKISSTPSDSDPAEVEVEKEMAEIRAKIVQMNSKVSQTDSTSLQLGELEEVNLDGAKGGPCEEDNHIDDDLHPIYLPSTIDPVAACNLSPPAIATTVSTSAPISGLVPAQVGGRNMGLLRLIESDLFDANMALNYLMKYNGDQIGIQFAICQRLLSLETSIGASDLGTGADSGLFFIAPQLLYSRC